MTEIAQSLIEIDAFKFQINEPFKWTSGWNSPVYCDNRLTLSVPQVRDLIKTELIKLINQKFPEVEAIAGVATAGIPQAALVADTLKLPLLYVRSSAKSHGMQNLIEGKLIPGQKIIVVEDLISTGGSIIKASVALQEAGFDVLGAVATFTYGFKAAVDNFNQAQLTWFSLTDYDELINQAVNSGKIQKLDLTSLRNWRENPDTWPQ